MIQPNIDQTQSSKSQIGHQNLQKDPKDSQIRIQLANLSDFNHNSNHIDAHQNQILTNPESQTDKVQITEKTDDISSALNNPDNQNQQNPKNNRVINYRPDVDGIRAVAILLVLIYHAYPLKIPGGFIGVDVFFVISGFLITQIVAKQILKGKFSLINFYSRRIKRIYPALILVLCFTLWVISKFTQIDLVTFSLETLNSALVFCANLRILVHKQDYFDADIRGNPLLHLWSLGVEEQFYIIWPFLLLFTFKCCQKRALKILAIFTALSFMFSIVSVYQDAKFAFYFPLCRFWQMSVGGLLGIADFTFSNKTINNTLSLVGLTAILITSFIIDDESLFPGFWTLLPTLGCACIIQAKNESFINKHVLSSKPFTFIGKISYSLYLWHWPLIVYSRVLYPHGSQSIFSNMSFIIGLAFALSILTYFIAENPIRKIKTKKVAIFLLILMGLVGFGSLYVDKVATQKYFSIEDIATIEFFKKVNRQMIPEEQDHVMINGRKQPNFSYNKVRILPTDITQVRAQLLQQYYEQAHGGRFLLEKRVDEDSKYADMLEVNKTYKIQEFAVANEGQQNQVFFIGDSHVEKISQRFQQLFRRNQIKGTLDKFPTLLLADRRGVIMGEENSLLNFTRVLVQKHKPKRMLIAWNWIYYFCKNLHADMVVPANCDQQSAKAYFSNFVNFLKQFENQGIEVYTIGVDINHIQYLPNHMIDANGIIEENLKPFKYSDFRKKYKFMYDLVEGSLNEANIKWIDTATNLCWEDVCQVISPKGYAPFIDIDHMGKFFASHWFTVLDHLVEF